MTFVLSILTDFGLPFVVSTVTNVSKFSPRSPSTSMRLARPSPDQMHPQCWGLSNDWAHQRRLRVLPAWTSARKTAAGVLHLWYVPRPEARSWSSLLESPPSRACSVAAFATLRRPPRSLFRMWKVRLPLKRPGSSTKRV